MKNDHALSQHHAEWSTGFTSLYHGDCMAVLGGIPDQSVDLVLTDIPFGGELERDSQGLRQFSKGAADVLTFDLADFAAECERVTRKTVWLFCGIHQVGPLIQMFKCLGLPYVEQRAWLKTNPSPANGGWNPLSSFENCVVACREPVDDRSRKAVLTYPHSGQTKLHPTHKPERLMAEIIRGYTMVGDTVADWCMGSGSTGVAAVRSDRSFVGVELQDRWFRGARDRILQEITECVEGA